MAEAIHQTVSHQTHDLSYARGQRLKSTLIFLLKEYKKYKAKLSEISEEQEEIVEEIEFYKEKREKLMAQNFSSAQHLKKTHTKYWDKIQTQKHLFEVKESQKQYCKNQIFTLQKKIPQIRSSLLSIVNQVQ